MLGTSGREATTELIALSTCPAAAEALVAAIARRLLAPFWRSSSMSRCERGWSEDGEIRSEKVLVRLNCVQRSSVSIQCSYSLRGLTVKVNRPAVANLCTDRMQIVKTMAVMKGAVAMSQMVNSGMMDDLEYDNPEHDGYILCGNGGAKSVTSARGDMALPPTDACFLCY
jgi:hypothetical protein